jgi:hypothetical protein
MSDTGAEEYRSSMASDLLKCGGSDENLRKYNR